MIKTIIIEDESKAISALKQEIAFNCSDIEIVGEASNVADGVKLIETIQPELIFLDIQLSDGTGFNLLEQVKKYSFKIIFTTAFSQYALDAFKFNTIDYLLKPIDGDELANAVNKIIHTSKKILDEQLNLFLENRIVDNSKKKIALHTSTSVRLIELQTIIRCNSQGNYTYFYFSDGSKLLISKTMKSFEKLLVPYGFVRIHHSNIINLDHLVSYHNNDGGYVVMSDKSHLSVAQRRKALLLKILDTFNE